MGAGGYAFPTFYATGGIASTLPSSWGAGFPSLQTLNLFGYNLVGSLPEEWGCSTCLPKLQILQITGNPALTGSLPSNWSLPGSFPELVLLNLAGTSLTGTLPQGWSSPEAFVSMTYLSLANTSLTGPLPTFDNKQLQVLDLSFTGFGGNISELWNSSCPLSAISLNSVPVRGTFPPKRPPFWDSLRILIVDNTSLTGTIPPSWLEVHNTTGAYADNYMHDIAFSGAQFWIQSWEDQEWIDDICSSLSTLAGYALTELGFMPSQLYTGIKNEASAGLDVTLMFGCASPELPSAAATTESYVSYYERITFFTEGITNFILEAPGIPGGPTPELPLLSIAGACPNQHRATYMIAVWSAFAALLAVLVVGYVLWRVLDHRHPALRSWRPPLPKLGWKLIVLLWKLVPILGLGLYLYDLVSDIQVVQAVWGLGSWYGKTVLAIILCHYIVRGVLVTVHLSRYHGQGRIRSALQFGLTLLCIPLIVPITLIMDVLSSLEFLPMSFGAIDVHGYRELRAIVMPVLQSLPSVIITTVIFFQGSSPTSIGYFQSINLLKYNSNPEFLTHVLYLQAAITSLGSILWGICELYHISHKRSLSLVRSLSMVLLGRCLQKGEVKVELACEGNQPVRLSFHIV